MKQIKKLALASYTKNNLDYSLVKKFKKNLNRSELKEYVTALKNIENKKNVVVTVVDTSFSTDLIKKMESIFKGKKILVKEDKSLIAGLRITDYDMVYELNLKNKIDKIVNFINN